MITDKMKWIVKKRTKFGMKMQAEKMRMVSFFEKTSRVLAEYDEDNFVQFTYILPTRFEYIEPERQLNPMRRICT